MTSSLRDRLIALPVYRPLRFVYRNVYQPFFDRKGVLERKNRRKLYSSFICPGDLAFDVGANRGVFAEALEAIGATVVAIEPDPRNLKILRNRLQRRHVHIESCALGSKVGTAELHFASDRVDLSTLSIGWAELHSNIAHWHGTVQVQVQTLDSIANKYGVPKFVKVDAEGHDAEVLRGMSFRPQMLSFEFLPRNLNIARECIQLLRDFSFNFVIEQRTQYELDHWVSGDEILAVLSAFSADAPYGDVFARNLD